MRELAFLAQHMSDLVAGALLSGVGALIVAGFTIVAVILANRTSRLQLRLQLQAAAEEATRARRFEMRRTVYLEGAEAIARANMLLGRMADLDMPNVEIARIISETIARLAKIQIVATLETVRAVSVYQATLSECLSALWPKRWELLARARVLADYDEQIKALAADRDRWLEQIKVGNVQGLPAAQPQVWKGLWHQHQTAERLRADFAAKHDALRLVQTREQLEYLEFCLRQAVPMLTVIPAALTHARAELEQPGDQATF